MVKNNNLGIFVLYSFIAIVIIYLIVKLLLKLNRDKNKNSKPPDSLLSTNYIDKNVPIYSNDDYKKNITCSSIPAPLIDGGARVNYYNSE
jgi:hypothetical protein